MVWLKMISQETRIRKRTKTGGNVKSLKALIKNHGKMEKVWRKVELTAILELEMNEIQLANQKINNTPLKTIEKFER